MKARCSAIGVAFLIGCGLALSGCGGTATLALNYKPSGVEKGPLASIPPKKFKLVQFIDKRPQKADAIMIGSRQAAFGVPMGDVHSERPVFEVVRDTVRTELVRNGHAVVGEGEDVSLGGEIQALWVRTDVTPVYWDVVGEVRLALEARKTGSGAPVALGPYEARKVERTYAYPSAAMMERVLGGSLEAAVKAMGSDPVLIKTLGEN